MLYARSATERGSDGRRVSAGTNGIHTLWTALVGASLCGGNDDGNAALSKTEPRAEQESEPRGETRSCETSPTASSYGSSTGARGLGPADVLRLQRVAGNHATVQVLARSGRLLQRKELSWHQQRAGEIHAALQASPENWEGSDPPGAYRVFNGLSNDDQIKVYRALNQADRRKLEDNLDQTTGDRARMYQAIQEAKAGAAGGSATGDWWREKAEEVHWAIRCSRFVNYGVEEDPVTHGRSQGAYWILSNHNDAARRRLMTFLDAESLDALLAHAAEADRIPGSEDIIRYAMEARAGRPKRTRAYAVEVGEQKVGEGTISLANTGQQVISGQVMATGPVSIAGMSLGSLDMVAFQNPTLASPGTTPSPPVQIPPGVPRIPPGSGLERIEKLQEAIRDLQKLLGPAKEVSKLSRAARGGLFVVLTLIVAGTIIVVAVAISNYRDRDELPEGGVDDIPQSDAGAPDPALAPGAGTPSAAVDPTAPAPAQAPGQAPGAAQAPGAEGGEAAQAPGGVVDDPAECARQNKAKILHDHHIFPQSLRDEFSRIGIPIDRYTITLPFDKHIGTDGVHHVFGWNDHWHVFFDEVPHRALSPAEQQRWGLKALEEAIDLMYLAGLSRYKVHPYRKP